MQAWRALEVPTRKRLVRVLWVVFSLLVGVAVLCRVHPASAEVVLRWVMLTTGLAMTPVILESLLWVVGFALVGALAYVRLQLEKRDWELAAAMGGGGVGEVVAEAVETGTVLATAEGFLEAGELDEAWDVLMSVPRDVWDGVDCARVRVRWAMLAKRWREGEVAAGLLEGDKGSAKAVAEFLMARARDVAVGADTGESGNVQARRAEVKRLMREAKILCPQVEG